MPSHSPFFLKALAATVVMAASGCICVVPGNRSGNIVLSWTFDGMTCAQQAAWASNTGAPRVVSVTIDMPGQTLQNNGTYPCTNSLGGDSIELQNFRPGSYSYVVRGWSAQGEELYSRSGSVTVNGDVANDVSLRAVKGGMALRWQFWNGVTYLSCSQAGVQTVYVNLQDSTGLWVYGNINGGAGYEIPCTTAWGDGVTFPWLAADTYTVVVQGYDTVNTLYRTDQVNPPWERVTAAVFPEVTNTTQIVLLAPQ